MEPASLPHAGYEAAPVVSSPRALTRESYELFCDEYVLTMAQSFWRHRQNGTACFEMSVRHLPPQRGYLVVAGIEQVLAYLAGLRFTPTDVAYLAGTGIYDEGFLDFLGAVRFTGDVDAIREGTVVGADTPLLRITAEVRGGGLRLITRPGIVVDAGDISQHGGSVTLPEPPGPGVPVQLRVEISGSVHGAGITAGPPPPPRRPRRTFWQWLRRAPRPPAIAA